MISIILIKIKNGEDALRIHNPNIQRKIEDKNEYFNALMNDNIIDDIGVDESADDNSGHFYEYEFL